MNKITQQVADNIRYHLNEEGYKAKHLAERLGISYSQATRLYNGKSAYRPAYIAVLAKMLGKDPERLVGTNPDATNITLTVKEAAARTKYHEDTIRKAVYRGEMKSSQRCRGGKYLIEEIDLAAWLAGAR